ncbi:hypothetical protein N7494_006830 [Penicillium frequentans]|uniref:RING-type domain-containing protein n=1 Tax=Penicillium frequentans TaxID=3151616 RepID=A0AAD6GFN9_9EURO|nr:hypothetical protein N7494_006830 [Penicillium glabrum]
MSISYEAQNRPQLIQEAIDNLFVEFGATVENRDWAIEQTQQSEESCVVQVLRDYENGAFPNGRVILAHDGEFIVLKIPRRPLPPNATGPISEREITPSDILIDLQAYQTWRLNPSEHLPRKPLYEVVEVSKDENRTCSICYELVSPHLEVIILPCGHWFEWCCIQSWFERSFTCPMCRANVLESSIYYT